jgi:hypothetical protein
VAVEKRTIALILVSFRVFVEQEFNGLQGQFLTENTPKRVFQQPRLITTPIVGR